MNRRILLIDADPAFRDTLRQQLAPYRFAVQVETDAEAAVAAVGADPPALVIVAVEEPDKSGFKVFQRLKKGAVGKTPIALATGSVVAESFAKHRGLKVHADEYFDKRHLDPAELLSRLGALVQLGAPLASDELDLPVEIDDIGVSDGEVVVDETVGDDDAQLGGREVSSARIEVDSAVEAETDAAFAALLGGEPEEPSRMVAPVVAAEPSEPAAAAADPVPEVVHDGGRSDEFDTFSRESMRPPPRTAGGEISAITPRELSARAVAAAEEAEEAGGLGGRTAPQEESSPAIELDPDELIEEDSGGVPEPVPDPNEPPPLAAVEAVPEPAAEEAPVHTPPPQRESGARLLPVPDLGLDQIHVDAASEPSGVYDRRALRKMGELERQIAQLKTELERARAHEAAPRAGGREREFLNLREQITTRDKEVAELKSELAVRARELTEARDARAELQSRIGQLEQRVAVVPELEDRARGLASKVSELEHVVEAKAQLERDLANERALREASASEAERALREEREQLVARHEGELAALRKELTTAQQAATDALREERAQLVAAHEQHLATVRGDAAEQRQQALDALRAELAAAQEAAVAATVEATRREVTGEADHAMSELEARHAADVARLAEEHASALAAVVGERDTANARLASIEDEHEDQIAQLQQQHAALVVRERALEQQLAGLQREHELSIENAERDLASALEAKQREQRVVVDSKQREHAAALAKAQAEHDKALAAVRDEHAEALASLHAEHHQTLLQTREDHAQTLASREQELGIAHAAAISDVETKLQQTEAAHAAAIAQAKQERDELFEQAEATIARLTAQHERVIKETTEAHGEELMRAAEDKQRAVDDVQRAAAEQRAAMDRTIVQLRDEAARYKETTDREIAEYRSALMAAKRALEDAVAKATAEREAADQAHAQAIAEQKAIHERAMAVANGEIVKTKSFADAELKRTIAAKDAEHTRVVTEMTTEHAHKVKELTSERDELARGLSSARDSLKRTETELSSAMNTIADRNAELRAHAQAIAERDERIAQLRKEIETLETENANYQEQVLRAYQKIKTDEAMVARAKKAMAIALTVLDDQGNPKADPT